MGDIRDDFGPCPRCGHAIPHDYAPGAFAGALSRSDNRTMVCSACGTHEAMLQFRGQDVSQSTWPVDVPVSLYERHRPEST